MRRLRLLRASLATLITTLLIGVVMSLFAPGALAHGDLVDGSPGPGDSLSPGGVVVALEFDELAEDGRALIAILDATGDPIAVGPAQTTADATAVCATTAALAVGVHTLEYSATSNDGDLIRGKYSFEVTDEGDAPDNDITAACADLTLEPAGEAQTLDEMGTGGFPAFLPYLLGALLILALALVVRRVRADRTDRTDEDEPLGGHRQPDREGAPDPED